MDAYSPGSRCSESASILGWDSSPSNESLDDFLYEDDELMRLAYSCGLPELDARHGNMNAACTLAEPGALDGSASAWPLGDYLVDCGTDLSGYLVPAMSFAEDDLSETALISCTWSYPEALAHLDEAARGGEAKHAAYDASEAL